MQNIDSISDAGSRARRQFKLARLTALVLAGSCSDGPRQPAEDSAANPRSAAVESAASRDVVAITNVTVIDLTAATPQPNMTVVVRGDRIAAMAREGAVDVPAGAIRVDATGLFLIPGLWDAHAHLSYAGECALPRMIAHGITSVRDLGGLPAEGTAWRKDIAEGRRIGPRLYLSGMNVESARWLNAVDEMLARTPDPERRSPWERSPRFKVDGARDAQSAADTAKQMGMNVVKFRNLGGKDFRALAQAARRHGIPLAGHSPGEVTLAEAAEAGLRSVEHSTNLEDLASLSSSERKNQYERIVRSGMFISPTLVSDGMWAPDSLVLATFADTAGRIDVRRRTLSPGQVAMWKDMIRDRRAWSKPTPRQVHDSNFTVLVGWVREAHRAGVPILAGTDLGTLLTYPGYSLHEELALLVERVGLTPVEALRSATVHPATFFGLEQEFGTVAAGQRADLVLLRANPLRDIRNAQNVQAVVAAGRYFGASDIAALNRCEMPRTF